MLFVAASDLGPVSVTLLVLYPLASAEDASLSSLGGIFFLVSAVRLGRTTKKI
ncbi:hypothetical protein ACQEV4_11620 [Streptomyces shenzhenensis]|uniref:hypothetical protein n=1 Tax=Streptomyces shenzhenensis TaxID=943815 RepID=UPI003D8D3A1E